LAWDRAGWAAADAVELTVSVRGVVTENDAAVLRKLLSRVSGARCSVSELQPGAKGAFGHYFSPPVSVVLDDPGKVDIGVLARAVAEAATPSRKEVPPSLNLVLYPLGFVIGESEVVALRGATSELAGSASGQPGGTGAVSADNRFWVRLDGSGTARLQEFVDAARKAKLDIYLKKP
jgi:hypothetical protein